MKAPSITLAALIAGGKSRRMGPLGDKAQLEWEGCPLWRRQLDILAGLNPERLAVAAPERPSWLPDAVSWVEDQGSQTGIGPIGGILGALESVQGGLVATLAVDLPAMTHQFLARLQAGCQPGTGAVPLSSSGFEPLAAVYPAKAAPLAREWIANGRRDLQGWIAELIQNGLVIPRRIKSPDLPLFRNLNRPEDLA